MVQLRAIDNSQVAFLPVDPIAGWSDTTFTSTPVNNFPPGPALVTVFTNGIPSDCQICASNEYAASPTPTPTADSDSYSDGDSRQQRQLLPATANSYSDSYSYSYSQQLQRHLQRR